jgi:hypothetical protein
VLVADAAAYANGWPRTMAPLIVSLAGYSHAICRAGDDLAARTACRASPRCST